jgi:arsenite-transporting ATPase
VTGRPVFFSLRYTLRVPSLDFFIGKGGVGKTTISSAYAANQAAHGGRVLLLSSDPAHSLFDVFALRSSRERQSIRIAGRKSLDLWQLDAGREFGEFLATYRDAVLDVIASGTIFSREEVAPLLDSTIPGMAEVSALLVLAELLDTSEYDRIVVDTAPLGHTLRLFELPDAFLKLLHFLQIAASRDQVLAQRFAHTRLAGPKFLADWQKRAASIREALAGPESRIVLVTTPEEFALNESARAKQALADSSPPLRVHEIVLNRAITRAGNCERCSAAARRTSAAKTFLHRHFSGTPLHVAEDIGEPIAGAASLLAYGEHVFEGKKLRVSVAPPKAPNIGFKPIQWRPLKTPLSLTIGKGGVGKTTISAALSYVTRRDDPQTALTICSTDPAPSLDDVFNQEIGNRAVSVLHDRDFRAMEMDAAADFHRWTAKLKDKVSGAFGGTSGRVHLDLSFEREVITALLDMVPPGMDELAATFRILDLLEEDQRVVIDMAPTGHALELLRMPERIQLWTRLILRALAPHRGLAMAQEAGVEIAKIGQNVRRLARTLHDDRFSKVYVVMLAEPLPDRETGRLIGDLHDLDVSLGPIFVNRVLLAGGSGCARCGRRARFQLATLARLRRARLGTLLAVPEQPTQVAGAAALKRFTRELWRIE